MNMKLPENPYLYLILIGFISIYFYFYLIFEFGFSFAFVLVGGLGVLVFAFGLKGLKDKHDLHMTKLEKEIKLLDSKITANILNPMGQLFKKN